MSTLILIFFLHFIADFILQPYWMKIQKSRQAAVMIFHIAIYIVILFFGLAMFIEPLNALAFALVNGAIHLCIDWGSSRIISGSSRDLKVRDGPEPLYERVDMYVPIIFLGIDQLLHHISLIATWHYLLQ